MDGAEDCVQVLRHHEISRFLNALHSLDDYMIVTVQNKSYDEDYDAAAECCMAEKALIWDTVIGECKHRHEARIDDVILHH